MTTYFSFVLYNFFGVGICINFLELTRTAISAGLSKEFMCRSLPSEQHHMKKEGGYGYVNISSEGKVPGFFLNVDTNGKILTLQIDSDQGPIL